MITKEQMESIAGEKGEYRFHGETSDGISYTWIYDGSKIKNPIEQKLKVEFSEENLDESKRRLMCTVCSAGKTSGDGACGTGNPGSDSQ